MSKSLNNFISAEDVIKKYGADALRYWSCGATLGMNLRWSEDDVKAGRKLLTKFWNAARFVMMNLENYNPKTSLSFNKLEVADQWILAELQKLIKEVTSEFEKYEFAKAKTFLEHFFWIKFTDNYIELVKARLYGNEKNKKLSAQFTLFTLLSSLVKLFAPILPHICEELYQQFIKNSHTPKSVHLCSWPKIKKSFEDKKLEKAGVELIEVIKRMRKSKAEKNIKLYEPVKNLFIGISAQNKKFFEKISNDLRRLAQAENIKIAISQELVVKIEK